VFVAMSMTLTVASFWLHTYSRSRSAGTGAARDWSDGEEQAPAKSASASTHEVRFFRSIILLAPAGAPPPSRRAPAVSDVRRAHVVIRSEHRVRFPLLQDEQALADAGHDDDAALEVRVVAPRPCEPGLRVIAGERLEEADLARVLAIRDVEDAESALVVGLVHQPIADVQVVVG